MSCNDIFACEIPFRKAERFIKSVAITFSAIFAIAYLIAPSWATVVTFGSGVNSFDMVFVTIGNPGNTPDTMGTPIPAGGVGYVYGIGKYEVSEDMINKFNASQSLQLNTDLRGAQKPATSVSWNEAARFVNWLNTNTGNFPAYNFATTGVNDPIVPWSSLEPLDYDPLNPYRSKRTTYALPSDNEWYKAAYYNPGQDNYFLYPTGSDSEPISVTEGTAPGTAVYNLVSQGPADVDKAGGLSPYGVMGLGGNVHELEETSFDFLNDSGLSSKAIRGGYWSSDSLDLRSTFRSSSGFHANKYPWWGFRVVTLSPQGGGGGGQVPEPTTLAIVALGATCMACRRRQH